MHKFFFSDKIRYFLLLITVSIISFLFVFFFFFFTLVNIVNGAFVSAIDPCRHEAAMLSPRRIKSFVFPHLNSLSSFSQRG